MTHKIVEMAIKENKRIVIRKLGKIDSGKKGNGNKGLKKTKQR